MEVFILKKKGEGVKIRLKEQTKEKGKGPNLFINSDQNFGGVDGTRTRDPRRDRPIF